MTTGSLEHPFARTDKATSRTMRTLSGKQDVDTSAGQQIGELSVHRESIGRVLAETPYSLAPILAALTAAVEGKTPEDASPSEVESEEGLLAGRLF
jgi:hypothetical protein